MNNTILNNWMNVNAENNCFITQGELHQQSHYQADQPGQKRTGKTQQSDPWINQQQSEHNT